MTEPKEKLFQQRNILNLDIIWENGLFFTFKVFYAFVKEQTQDEAQFCNISRDSTSRVA